MFAPDSFTNRCERTLNDRCRWRVSSVRKAREAARSILPNMTETKMVVTGNLRAWVQVIDRRTAPDADAELQEVMGMARDVLKPLAPSIFKD